MAVLTPGLRKLALTAHVAASVGWLGAVIAYLALCVRAFNDDRRLMRVVTNPTAHGKNDVKRSLVVEKVQRPPSSSCWPLCRRGALISFLYNPFVRPSCTSRGRQRC